MNLIKFNNDGEEYEDPTKYHANGIFGSDYTLCGRTLDGDSQTLGGFKNVQANKVTCDDCVAIIEYCKRLKT